MGVKKSEVIKCQDFTKSGRIYEVDFQKSEAVVLADLGTAIRLFRVRSAAGGGVEIFPAVILQVSLS